MASELAKMMWLASQPNLELNFRKVFDRWVI
jgi:hypothetical protein